MTKDNLEIGLDRLHLSNLEVIGIDFTRFRGYYEKGKGKEIVDMRSGEVTEINKLIVKVDGISKSDKDNYKIKLDLKNVFGNYHYVITTNAPKLLYNSNENNIHKMEHLKQLKDIIVNELSKEGVLIDLDNATVTDFEINTNSHNSKMIDSLKLIANAWKFEGNKVPNTDTKNGLESILLKRSDRKIKVYNKAKQLDDTLQLKIYDDTVRVEVSTNKQTTITRIIGCDNTLDNFIEGFEDIQLWYKDCIRRDIKKPLKSYIEKLENHIIDRMNNKEKTSKILLDLALNGDMVDLDIFSNAIKKQYKLQGKKSPSNVIRNQIKKLDTDLVEKLSGNLEAINQFFDELGI